VLTNSGVTERHLTGVGAELKQAREAAGLAIDHVAERLRFAPRQVESLENERFERLPGPTIARGMVRNYARLLDLDPEPLVGRMPPPGDVAPERGRTVARDLQPMPSPTRGRRSALLYAGSSVALLALIGAVAYQWRQEKDAPRPVAQIEPVPVVVPLEKPVERQVERQVAPPSSEKPREAEAAAEPPAPPPAIPHRLILRMEEEAWLEVRDGAGRSLVSSLHAAGSERAVRGQPPFQLVIGNALHVELTYEGKPVDLKPHIRGEVARLTLK